MVISLQYFLEVQTHENIEPTYSKLSNAKNWEPISTKSIINTNTSNKAKSENNVLKNLRLKNSEKVIIGNTNIISLRNKFELLTEMVWDKFDLLVIPDAKFNSSFSDA